MALATPVAFVVFNRPRHTATSFAAIRRQRPTQLFLIADGPRAGHDTDAQRCREVRETIEHVDWPCAVTRIYAPMNLGLKARVSSGLDEVFSHVDRAIVLEDDCVPNDDFFGYCETLLARYEDDDRVAALTGDNFQDGITRGDGSYYFSKYTHCWGWATWRDRWHDYDGDISFWPQFQGTPAWQRLHPDVVERRYWEHIFDRVANGEIDSWAYPWQATVWYHEGLTATPNVNLVRNIGFGPEATHTRSGQQGPDHLPLGAVRHPDEVAQDRDADQYVFDHHFGGRYRRWPGRPLVLARRLLARAVRWASARDGRR